MRKEIQILSKYTKRADVKVCKENVNICMGSFFFISSISSLYFFQM